MLLAGLALVTLQAASPPPDVLLLIADDVADSDLDAVSTPNIDALAARGVRFRRAYSNPMCTPTRLAMMFGRWEISTLGSSCESPPSYIPPSPSDDSLPKWLARAGYETALFGKWHAGSNTVGPWELSPILHGFDTWRAGSPANVANCGGSGYTNWMRVDDGISGLTSEYHTIAVRDELLAWWGAGGQRRPRLAWVGFQTAHVPLHVPPQAVHPGPCALQVLTKRDKFECMLESLDYVVGQILGAVDLERTLVIFVADNGTPAGAVGPNQNPNKVKKTTFEGGIRVPLILAGPGIEGGRETRALAHVVDLIATLADGLDVPPPAGASKSVSLWPVLTGAQRVVRDYVFSGLGTSTGVVRDRAVVTARWKLREDQGVLELYDLLVDPLEESPIEPEHAPEVMAQLHPLLLDP